MQNKEEIIKFMLRFVYGATEVFLHSYPDEETLQIKRYVTFSVEDMVKHMLVEYRDTDFDFDFDVSAESLVGNDGMIMWRPTEIVLFPVEKVAKEIATYRDIFYYEGDYVPLSIVSGFLTRIKITSSG